MPLNIEGQAKLILKGAGLGLLKPKFFVIDQKEANKEDTSQYETSKSSKWGLPMFDEFKFNANSANQLRYTASSDFGGGEVIISAPFTFETALLTINQSKNIIVTKIAGRNGSVKEYMSDGDFVVNLKGFIAGDIANQAPNLTKLDTLTQYLNAPLAIPVTSNFLDAFKISNLVITDYSYSQREGMRNVIDINIDFLSDSPIELSKVSEGQKSFF